MERLLRCDCGSEIVVITAQAGSQIVCSQCGTRLQVPTLRELSHLPAFSAVDSPMDAKSLSQSIWRWRGPLMAICAGILMIALVFALFFLSNWYSVDSSFNAETHVAAVGDAIERSGADELMQLWDDYARLSLKFPVPPQYKINNDWAERNLRNGKIALLIGVAMLVSFFVLWISGKSAQRKKLAKGSAD
jgi:hypothetical protein